MQKEFTLAQLRLECPRCGQSLEVAQEVKKVDEQSHSEYIVFAMRDVVTDYLSGVEEVCPNVNCRGKIDWWKTILRKVREADQEYGGFLLAGGQITAIQITLNPSTSLNLRFHDVGIPVGSRILSIRYSMKGIPMERFLFPLEGTRNLGEPIRRSFPNSITIYPYPDESGVFAGTEPKPSNWNAYVAWIPPHVEDGAISGLAEAFHALYENRLLDVPLAIQSVVEGKLRELLASVMRQHISRDSVRELLVKSLTFNQQLNSIYPLILGILDLPVFPDDIRGKINSLSNARNRIAHGASGGSDLTLSEMADGVSASLFAYKHMALVQDLLNQRQ